MFNRILGNTEIVGAHRWVEDVTSKCCACNKLTYTLLIWNKKVSYLNLHGTYYTHTLNEPIKFKQGIHNDPVVVTKTKVHQMLPLKEFYERVVMYKKKNTSTCRWTNTKLEKMKNEELETLIESDLENQKPIDHTYWNAIQKIYRSQAEKKSENENKAQTV